MSNCSACFLKALNKFDLKEIRAIVYFPSYLQNSIVLSDLAERRRETANFQSDGRGML
jgi:hypothetical protein